MSFAGSPGLARLVTVRSVARAGRAGRVRLRGAGPPPARVSREPGTPTSLGHPRSEAQTTLGGFLGWKALASPVRSGKMARSASLCAFYPQSRTCATGNAQGVLPLSASAGSSSRRTLARIGGGTRPRRGKLASSRLMDRGVSERGLPLVVCWRMHSIRSHAARCTPWMAPTHYSTRAGLALKRMLPVLCQRRDTTRARSRQNAPTSIIRCHIDDRALTRSAQRRALRRR